jgi:hypothetical protein
MLLGCGAAIARSALQRLNFFALHQRPPDCSAAPLHYMQHSDRFIPAQHDHKLEANMHGHDK